MTLTKSVSISSISAAAFKTAVSLGFLAKEKTNKLQRTLNLTYLKSTQNINTSTPISNYYINKLFIINCFVKPGLS